MSLVKDVQKRRSPKRRSLRAALALALAMTTSALPSPTRADEDQPPAKPKPRGPEPSPGRYLITSARPVFTPDLRACSTRTPICVHASTARDGEAALATLGAFERAWQTLTGSLALPAPDVDPTTLAYDVFVVEPHGALVTTELESRDLRSRVDRGRAFSTVDRRVRPSCTLDGLAAEAVARASLFRVAPGTEEGTALAQTAYLAELAVPCTVGLAVDRIRAFQSAPNRTFADARTSSESMSADAPGDPSPADVLFSRGAGAFWARLEWAFGRTPGGIVSATWALHPTMTPVGTTRFENQPDTFDVLRKTFKGAMTSGGTVSDLWLDFAVARAFFGSADDGQHLPELRTLGDAARVPLDWDIPWPQTPRRLAGRFPIYPTGSGYLVVRRAGAKPGARLRVETEWESRALFRWALVKLDAAGRELGRVVVPTTERATSAQMTLVDLDNVDRILLVGVNLGDPAYGFDPDDEVWEPHGFVVTVAEE